MATIYGQICSTVKSMQSHRVLPLKGVMPATPEKMTTAFATADERKAFSQAELLRLSAVMRHSLLKEYFWSIFSIVYFVIV